MNLKLAPLGDLAPVGSGGEGNTSSPPKKRFTASKRWCFTLNNYIQKDVCSIGSAIKEYCRFGIFGKENGEKGTRHLQGYLEFKKKDRPINKKYGWSNKIHWEKAKGDKQDNITYCEKEGGEIFIHPVPYQVKIENWYDWELEIIKTLKKAPDDRTIYWVWEESGCAGKTVFQKWLFKNLKKRTTTLSGKGSDMKNGIIQYEQKNGNLPEVILINIPRCKKNFVDFAGIEEIKDMWFFSGKYEGGMVCGPNPHVVVFANEPPNEELLSKDRWEILYIGNNEKLKKGHYDDEIESYTDWM